MNYSSTLGKTSEMSGISGMSGNSSLLVNDSEQILDRFVMQGGNKTVSRKISHDVFLRLSIHHSQKTKKWLPGSYIFNQALENVKPAFEISKKRQGGATKLIPVPCPLERQKSLALRWLLKAARSKKREKKKIEISFALAQVIYSSFCREGKVFQIRNEIHKLAEVNRMAIR